MSHACIHPCNSLLGSRKNPEVWCSKNVGNIILAEMEATKLNEGVLALLASFCLLYFDYPCFLEIGLIVLQHYVLKDINSRYCWFI
jgi:hypothetical protein